MYSHTDYWYAYLSCEEMRHHVSVAGEVDQDLQGLQSDGSMTAGGGCSIPSGSRVRGGAWGRGQEEVELLHKAGVRGEVVPAGGQVGERLEAG